MPDDLRSRIISSCTGSSRQSIRRFYSLMIKRDLFGTIRLVRHWGRIGTNGQKKAEEFGSEDEAGKALEILAQALRR